MVLGSATVASVAIWSSKDDCHATPEYLAAGGLMYVSYLALFIHFFYGAYMTKRAEKVKINASKHLLSEIVFHLTVKNGFILVIAFKQKTLYTCLDWRMLRYGKVVHACQQNASQKLATTRIWCLMQPRIGNPGCSRCWSQMINLGWNIIYIPLCKCKPRF